MKIINTSPLKTRINDILQGDAEHKKEDALYRELANEYCPDWVVAELKRLTGKKDKRNNMPTLKQFIEEKVKEFDEKFIGTEDAPMIDSYANEQIKSFLTQALRQAALATAEAVRGESKCWCGGGRHFAKSYCVVHISECALNNRGYRSALSDIKAKEQEWFKE
jgi:hypothetical protein